MTFIFLELGLAIAFGVLSNQARYNKAAILEWIISLIYIFYVWSFIIDFLPATHTRHKNDRFGPPRRAKDDENAMETQQGGNMLGGPVYTNGGGFHANDAASYGSAVPMAETGYHAPTGRPGASSNF